MAYHSEFRAPRRTKMAYQVIARKYRPQRFSDVVGQDHVTRTLSHAIEQKRIAHAYIFCGPRGTGKTTIARIFAKALNCTGGPKADFDDNDERCKEIAEGRSIDVLEIDGASNNGVEQVRELRETCKYVPASSRFKIYIIDEVHMLSVAAFNALLKTLEEPPEHVKFMFATTDPEKVLPTILSRCQRFDLRRIPMALIAKHLAQIAEKEKVKVTPAALHAIARGSEGALRDAESTLDQLISFCGGQIEESDVLSMFGLTAQGEITGLCRAVLEGDAQTLLRNLNNLANSGKDLGRLLSDLLNLFRNLLIFQVSRGDLSMLEVSEAEEAALREQSKLSNVDALTRILEILGDTEIRLRNAASKKTLLEVALMKSLEARTALSLDTVLKQLQELRSGQSSPTPPQTAAGMTLSAGASASATQPIAAPRAFAAQQTASTPASASPAIGAGASAPAAPSTASPALEELWSKLIEAVGRVSPFTRTYLLEAHPVSFERSLLIIGFDPEFEDHIGLVDNSRNHTLLRTKLGELGHPDAQFKFIKAEAPLLRSIPAPAAIPEAATSSPGVSAKTGAPATAETAPSGRKGASSMLPPKSPPSLAPSPEDFKNDPLIQKALEVFKGQIVEVRA